MINTAPKYISKLKVNPHNVIVWQEYVGDAKRHSTAISLKNLELSKDKKDISKKAQQRLSAALHWMLLLAAPKQAENYKSGKLFTYRLAMLTLTLPAAQMHYDLYIKKYLLNEFLTIIRKRYNVVNYIWKAEKQFNGNIHFHLIVDKYIHYKEANSIWNKILDTHGYIEAYRRNQQEFHKDGFHDRPELHKYWSKQQQIKAYKQGLLTNWSQPVSTTDVHSLKKIKNTHAYLAKYMSKNPDGSKYMGQQMLSYKRRHNCTTVPDWKLQEIKDYICKHLHIDGNIWYISRQLSKLKIKSVDFTEKIQADYMRIVTKFKDKIIESERCTIFCLNIHELVKFKFNAFLNVIKDFTLTMRNIFYPPGELDKNILGIPLQLFD